MQRSIFSESCSSLHVVKTNCIRSSLELMTNRTSWVKSFPQLFCCFGALEYSKLASWQVMQQNPDLAAMLAHPSSGWKLCRAHFWFCFYTFRQRAKRLEKELLNSLWRHLTGFGSRERASLDRFSSALVCVRNITERHSFSKSIKNSSRTKKLPWLKWCGAVGVFQVFSIWLYCAANWNFNETIFIFCSVNPRRNAPPTAAAAEMCKRRRRSLRGWSVGFVLKVEKQTCAIREELLRYRSVCVACKLALTWQAR